MVQHPAKHNAFGKLHTKYTEHNRPTVRNPSNKQAYQSRGRHPFSPLGHPPTSVSMKKNTLRSVKKPRVGPGDNRDLVKRVGIYFLVNKDPSFSTETLTIFRSSEKGSTRHPSKQPGRRGHLVAWHEINAAPMSGPGYWVSKTGDPWWRKMWLAQDIQFNLPIQPEASKTRTTPGDEICH